MLCCATRASLCHHTVLYNVTSVQCQNISETLSSVSARVWMDDNSEYIHKKIYLIGFLQKFISKKKTKNIIFLNFATSFVVHVVDLFYGTSVEMW